MTLLLALSLAHAQDYRAPFSDAHHGYFYPTAYFDHGGRDWACGSIRYSGHRGSDYGGGSWSGMSAGRDIVAAAEGRVVATNDGEYDQCSTGDCSGGGGFGNYVAIQHDDGKITYYAHLKRWTVAVSNGQTVRCGTHLGQMGSSGYSTGPHLHFASRSTSGSMVDPFDGPCSGPPTYWVTQGSHGGLPGRSCDTQDADGDGWDDASDCDDTNPRVNPGATEVCDDGLDNDCRGGDAASEIWYDDDDGDGYGDDAVRVCGAPPAGAVRAGGDCDDTRVTVSPAAPELCDSLDNDCDIQVDEGSPTTMGDPAPPLAAMLQDGSSPGRLAPGEAGDVWFVFENVGSETWRAGELWLSTLDDGRVSPLQDEESWRAWHVVTALEHDVAPGQTGALTGRVRAPADSQGLLHEQLVLRVGDALMRCPGGELELTVQVGRALGAGEDEVPPPPAGCSHSAPPKGVGLLLLASGLARRRRC